MKIKDYFLILRIIMALILFSASSVFAGGYNTLSPFLDEHFVKSTPSLAEIYNYARAIANIYDKENIRCYFGIQFNNIFYPDNAFRIILFMEHVSERPVNSHEFINETMKGLSAFLSTINCENSLIINNFKDIPKDSIIDINPGLNCYIKENIPIIGNFHSSLSIIPEFDLYLKLFASNMPLKIDILPVWILNQRHYVPLTDKYNIIGPLGMVFDTIFYDFDPAIFMVNDSKKGTAVNHFIARRLNRLLMELDSREMTKATSTYLEILRFLDLEIDKNLNKTHSENHKYHDIYNISKAMVEVYDEKADKSCYFKSERYARHKENLTGLIREIQENQHDIRVHSSILFIDYYARQLEQQKRPDSIELNTRRLTHFSRIMFSHIYNPNTFMQHVNSLYQKLREKGHKVIIYEKSGRFFSDADIKCDIEISVLGAESWRLRLTNRQNEHIFLMAPN